LNQGDDLNFVEVFSEQDIRLLLFPVDERPPSGPYERSRRVDFSDGRSLEASLAFTNPWPTLHVVYLDPLLASHMEMEAVESESPIADDGEQRPMSRRDASKVDELTPERLAPKTESFLGGTAAAVFAWLRALDWRFVLKPGIVTTIIA